MNDDLTREGKHVADTWAHAKQSVDNAQQALNRAECNLSNAADALVKWLLPDDAQPGEKICVWYVDNLIQVEVGGSLIGRHVDGLPQAISSHKITLRKRGKQSVSPVAGVSNK